MASYLDKTGLNTLWTKIKSIVPTKTSDLQNDSGYLTEGLKIIVDGLTYPVIQLYKSTVSGVSGLSVMYNNGQADASVFLADGVGLNTVKTAIESEIDGKMDDVPVTTSDNGKVLRVVNGTWQAVNLPSANGGSF